jgi:uncharacterized protein YjbI with pentapeptide repeats
MPRPTSASETQRQQRERRQAETLAKLGEIVKNSSEQNRNFFIAYLALLIYVQAIIFSTTDLQLLVPSEGLKLPIIDLTVPLVGFYVVIPMFVIALHFNFLQNLESHHYKLMRWQQAHPDGKVPRSSIYPFLFDYAILERSGQLLDWVRWANNLLCYNFAPITLGLLLIRFSDRQDFPITAWHYLTFVFDVYLVWKLRLAMNDNEQTTPAPPDSSRWWLRCWRFCTHGFRYGLCGVFGLLILLETLLTGMIAETSDDYFVHNMQPLVQTVLHIDSDLDYWQPSERGLQSIKPMLKMVYKPIKWLIPRIVIKPSDTVWKPDNKELESTAKLAGSSDWVKYFNEYGQGFRPDSDSLRLIRLRRQNLPRAQLQNIRLQGADLSWAELQGANLSWAELQGAKLEAAKLQGADLTGTQLQGADLVWAELQGAKLVGAKLQGANLTGAKLQGADLLITELQGANLSRAKLQGADLTGAQLQGADLSETQLQGVILHKTTIQGVKVTSKTAVFGMEGQSDLFAQPEMNWEDLTKLAKTIPDAEYREQYRQRIQKVQEVEKSNQASVAEQNLHYDPKEIARTALPMVCVGGKSWMIENRLASTQAFRHQYFDLQNEHDRPDLKQNPAYQDLLIDIDLKLCTLKECADLRDDIEGLDCKPYIEKSTKKP